MFAEKLFKTDEDSEACESSPKLPDLQQADVRAVSLQMPEKICYLELAGTAPSAPVGPLRVAPCCARGLGLESETRRREGHVNLF
jgi:hypothetical protein